MGEPVDCRLGDDLQLFAHSLAQTFAWCGLQQGLAEPSKYLRSLDLQPDFYDPSRRWQRYNWGTISKRSEIVGALAAKREALLPLRGWSDTTSIGSFKFKDGRFALYYPDANLYDGAAEIVSGGFFDTDNVPPWDTWVQYVTEPVLSHPSQLPCSKVNNVAQEETYLSYLISWVPPEFTSLADAGLWANPEQCIVWADEVDTTFVRRLRKAGIL